MLGLRSLRIFSPTHSITTSASRIYVRMASSIPVPTDFVSFSSATSTAKQASPADMYLEQMLVYTSLRSRSRGQQSHPRRDMATILRSRADRFRGELCTARSRSSHQLIASCLAESHFFGSDGSQWIHVDQQIL